MDASLRGLGACLIQDGKPIAFASKSLTGAESRYANIERELLAIIFACIWFNTYLQGHRFTVQSDHKPLEMIHLKSMHNAPPCLQRMLLQLQKYDMETKYKPGSEMLLADALSRCPARYSQEIKLDLRVDYIAFTSAWIKTLRETTCEEPVHQQCISLCSTDGQRRGECQMWQNTTGISETNCQWIKVCF